MSEYVKATAMENYLGMLEELLNLESSLSSWEMDFIESLNNWDGAFTEKQAETLTKIYDKLC